MDVLSAYTQESDCPTILGSTYQIPHTHGSAWLFEMVRMSCLREEYGEFMHLV